MNDRLDFLKNKLGVEENEMFVIDGDTHCFFREGRLYMGNPNGNYNESSKVLKRLIYDEYKTVDKFIPKSFNDFKVGDRVRIRQWDDMVNDPYCKLNCDGSAIINYFSSFVFVSQMKHLCGRLATIKKIQNDSVWLTDWSTKMGTEDWQYCIFMIEKIDSNDNCSIPNDDYQKSIDRLNREEADRIEDFYRVLLIKTIEEQSELIQVLCKYLREGIDPTMVVPSDELFDHECEKIGDVQICLSRLMEYSDKDMIKSKIKEKLNRCFDRLRGSDDEDL